MQLLTNKKAHFEYAINKEYVAGIVLTGAEVKSLRLSHGSLSGSYVKVIHNELFLINAQINTYAFAANPDYEPKKTRKLLLKKQEIRELQENSQQKGWAIVPLSIELQHNQIKVRIGLGKGKKEFEKRETIKKRELKRELSHKMKMSQLKF